MRTASVRRAWLGMLVGSALLCACGETGTPASTQTNSGAAAEPATETPAAQATQETADATPGVLTVGDQAPPLSSARWFRGEAREAVTPGRVTLVEFWATWCGPCITVMPHISELAETLGPRGLDVVAVSLDQGASAEQVVETFLEERADIVSFEVMLDEGATGRDWFEAAGRSGIPCSFVVAQDGRIAWIGHPMEPASDGSGNQLDRVIEGLLDGTYDIDAQARAAGEAAAAMASAAAEQTRVEEQVAELSAEMGKLWSQGDRRGVLEYIDQIVAIDPDNSHDLAQRKIEILLYELGEAEEALSAARALLAEPYADDSGMMLTMASLFSGGADPGEEGRAFAVDTARRVVALTDGTDPTTLVVLAEALFASGEPGAAVDTMRGALSLVDETSPAYATYELVLARYQSAAEAAGPADASAGG